MSEILLQLYHMLVSKKKKGFFLLDKRNDVTVLCYSCLYLQCFIFAGIENFGMGPWQMKRLLFTLSTKGIACHKIEIKM